ncbi:MAG: YceD family protein [Gaiellaceae bacterium]
MTTFNLRRLRLRSGEQFHDRVEVEIEPLVLGGQEYRAEPALVPADLTVTKASSGTVFELSFRVRLEGPCFRCLAETALELPIGAREYQAVKPGEDPDLRSPYVAGDVLELSAWAHDALALELPDKILHDADCAGLCPVCGKDLNVEPHTHEVERSDPRWAALADYRLTDDMSA